MAASSSRPARSSRRWSRSSIPGRTRPSTIPAPRDDQAVEEAEIKVKELTRESRDLAGKAKEIEDAVYDLKAVNPNKKPNVDTRTPEELLDIIEAKGREVAAALATLRGNKNSV